MLLHPMRLSNETDPRSHRANGKNHFEMYEPVSASDVESAKGRFVIPGDLDPHQFLQVHGLGHGRCLVHACRVVDRRNVEIPTPIPLLVAFAEDLVADALDVGVTLQRDYAFP